MQDLFMHLTNTERAIELVRNAPEELIDLNCWCARVRHRRVWYAPWRKKRVVKVGAVTEQDITSYAAGVTACIGGLIACDPYFKALGVRRERIGMPTMPGAHCSLDVSAHLFGKLNMFAPASCVELEGFKPHKQIALERLQRHHDKLLRKVQQVKLEPARPTLLAPEHEEQPS